MKLVYLDNASTTKMSEKVIFEMTKSFSENYGNPSSTHTLGQHAKFIIERARKIISKNLKVDSSEIIFTSGGAESNNLAIRGFLKENKNKGKHIITTKIEHATVLNTFKRLEEEGYEVSFLNVSKDGIIDVDELKSLVRDDTALVSVMFANNETGVIQPIKEIGEFLSQKNIFFHTDAVQAIGKLKINPKELKINALSSSAHKFYGPKGVGFLFLDKKNKIEKEIWGGHQERNLRAGTENVHGILGMGVAFDEVYEKMDEIFCHEQKIQEYLEKKLEDEIGNICEVSINGKNCKRVKNITNVTIKGTDIQMLLVALDMRKICVSGGSACMSGSLEPSHVLKNMGFSDDKLKSSFRISTSKYTTIEEIDYFIKNLKEIL